ncbi:phage tail tube protein [uncultured Fusobacterium sp.]|uniref:phage tail tube protein n=1 Tax=uncultured Fusobacterium sp. TaxID=159267 RepID=UPI0015A532FF|nr:phage tail tube protein [uncultured Fusobacterium sp.]DAQ00441.1 MAG TPA: tail tube protein [Caudoviricetes sp.]
MEDFLFRENDVVSGSFGKCYIGGRHWAELLEFEAKLKLDSKDVLLAGGEKGKKNTSSAIEIKLKLQKVFSTELELLKSIISGNLNPTITINVQLDDPEARGAEALAFNDCIFTGDIDLGSFKSGELTERELTLSCVPSRVEILESIADV